VENVLRATAMPTFELMHAALNGHIPTAAEMVQSTRPASSRSAIGNAMVAPQSIGDLAADLSYTPLPLGRCRIADSRPLNNPPAALATRDLFVTQMPTYASQGGSGPFSPTGGSATCGLPAFPAAYAMSVTLIDPAGDGVFKVYPYNQAHQTGATSVVNAGNYFASENLIVTACVNCAYDISIQTSTQVHYVVDVIGYFMPPVATALSCVTTAPTTQAIAASETESIVAPACPPTYTQTATNCGASSPSMAIFQFSEGMCAARNNGFASANLTVNRTCCRVPGR
jgi:hypothetical protein